MNKCKICKSKINIVVMDNTVVCWKCLEVAFKQYMKENLTKHKIVKSNIKT